MSIDSTTSAKADSLTQLPSPQSPKAMLPNMISHEVPVTEIPDEELYSTFTRYEKWYIVFLISFAAWFSTLSSFIYYPAISQIAHNLNTTVSRINLTVAAYMAVSTVAPAFVGDAADVLGRRALYLIVIAIYLAANIALANASSFAQLLGLRMLQSAGVAGKHVNQAGFSSTYQYRDLFDCLRGYC
jgi:Major Facilitator Superfamily